MSKTLWNIDPTHSDVLFSIKHLGISTVRGKFDAVSGTASFDPSDPDSLELSVSIDAASLNTGNEQRDVHVKSGDFLDVEKYPAITFVSKGLHSASATDHKLVGDLTIRDVTKEVTLNVEGPSEEVTDPYGNVKVAASATGSINRKEFGLTFHAVVDSGALLLGDEVKLTLEIQFVKQA